MQANIKSQIQDFEEPLYYKSRSCRKLKNSKKRHSSQNIDLTCKKHSPRYIEERGEFVCINCGLVLDEKVIDPINSTNQLIPYKTQSNNYNKNKKQQVSYDLRRAFQKDRMIYSEKRIVMGVVEIERLCSKLEIPRQIMQFSESLFKKAIKKLRNHQINLLASMCLFYCCEKERYPIEMKNLIEDRKHTHKLASRYYIEILKALNLRNSRKHPETYVPVIANKLMLSQEIQMMTRKLIEIYQDTYKCNSNSLKGICAGCIYMACKCHSISRSQTDIASCLSISELTLRSRYSEIMKACRRTTLDF